MRRAPWATRCRHSWSVSRSDHLFAPKGSVAIVLMLVVTIMGLSPLMCGGIPAQFTPLPHGVEGLREHLTILGIGVAETMAMAFALVADLTLGLNLLHLPERRGLAGLANDVAGARSWLVWLTDLAAADSWTYPTARP